MTRKVEERDIVLDMRTKIDDWNSEQDINRSISDDAVTSTQPRKTSTCRPRRIRLAAPQRRITVPDFLEKYEHIFTDGLIELHQFLRKSFRLSISVEQLKIAMVGAKSQPPLASCQEIKVLHIDYTT